ncbi:832_t:CDS:1, partial [Funneliformis geosporum]
MANHHLLTWKERIMITLDILNALHRIHKVDAIHRDLHSGNILHSPRNYNWYISDFGFCGPADKPSDSIYGNLPYIAPEVIARIKEYTKASDIYSVAILMWEISAGKPPFKDHNYDKDLAMCIVNGMRPKILPGTPLEYKKLIEQCWDADPSKRPDINTLYDEVKKISKLYYQNKNETQMNNYHNKINLQIKINNKTSKSIDFLFKSSKVYCFNNFPNPRNATK